MTVFDDNVLIAEALHTASLQDISKKGSSVIRRERRHKRIRMRELRDYYADLAGLPPFVDPDPADRIPAAPSVANTLLFASDMRR